MLYGLQKYFEYKKPNVLDSNVYPKENMNLIPNLPALYGGGILFLQNHKASLLFFLAAFSSMLCLYLLTLLYSSQASSFFASRSHISWD